MTVREGMAMDGRDLSARLCRAAQPGQRSLSDPYDRRRLSIRRYVARMVLAIPNFGGAGD
jgi:hypothetical protein